MNKSSHFSCLNVRRKLIRLDRSNGGEFQLGTNLTRYLVPFAQVVKFDPSTGHFDITHLVDQIHDIKFEKPLCLQNARPFDR